MMAATQQGFYGKDISRQEQVKDRSDIWDVKCRRCHSGDGGIIQVPADFRPIRRGRSARAWIDAISTKLDVNPSHTCLTVHSIRIRPI